MLYVSARGLTTSSIPFGERTFQLDFDLLSYVLRASTSDGAVGEIALSARPVAQFYAEVMGTLAKLGIDIRIHDVPNEILDAIRFSEDRTHAAYDPEYARRNWEILLPVERVFYAFRTSFIGKCSPVHFFWGSFDLAVTRFSGRALLCIREVCPICRTPWRKKHIPTS